MAQYISDDKKKEIIRQIRDEGKKAAEVATANGISTKTIYNWLRSGVSGEILYKSLADTGTEHGFTQEGVLR